MNLYKIRYPGELDSNWFKKVSSMVKYISNYDKDRKSIR